MPADRRLRAAALLLCLGVVACTDDDTVSGIHAAPEAAEPAAAVGAAAKIGAPPVESSRLVSRARPRFGVELQVHGEFAPGGTISLTLRGVANEPLTGGTVRLMLPTIEAMAHAGAGNAPGYPAGEKFPAEGEWKLARMDAGDAWTRSVKISLPAEGYYQVAVTATTESEDRDPYVLDLVDFERWLLVRSSGVLVTDHFDASEMPSGVAHIEGPFRRRSEAEINLSPIPVIPLIPPNTVGLHLVYYADGARRNAVGAKVTVYYYDQLDEIVRGYEKTVPSSGMVYPPCTEGDFEHMRVTVSLPSTAEVGGHRFITGGTGYYSDCGNLYTMDTNSYLYLVWRNLNQVIPVIEGHFGVDRALMPWKMRYSPGGNTYYSPSGDYVSFDYGSYNDVWAVGHEFAHALHHKSLGGVVLPSNCGEAHNVYEPSSYSCALNEGFADYAADLVDDGEVDFEDFHDELPEDRDPAEVEGNVAASLYDLIDASNETGDQTTYSAYYVGQVLKTCRAGNRARADITDVVWCLENRVDSDLHELHFPRGREAPSMVTEGALEPSHWSAAAVRSTWLHNLGR